MVISSKIIFMVPVNIDGPTEGFIMDTGSTIRWKARELSPGPTVEDMKEIM